MLKRKLEESAGEGTTSNGQSESDDSNCSAGSTDALAPEASGPSPPKRMKKKVNFKGVTVYYFPRRQGFTCVPSEGGSTLGMSEKHSFTKDFSLSDYTKEQKRIHRAKLAEQRRQGKMFPSSLLAPNIEPVDNDDDISSGSESDSEYDDYYFLQPLPIRQRRVLLRTAGVKKIDNEEKDECRDIRVSRNICGCDCKVFCDPATCTCSMAGIQCQVDRLSFPCGCTKDGCSNPNGRIEFNPIRVRTHFIHTLMRLELERKDFENPESTSASGTTASLLQSTSGNVDIDVVGANGEEVEDMTNSDSCSGASTDSNSSSSSGKLKSKLKLNKAEAIDLNLFNSNEKGSCRDCQNTDMCNVMMHDVKFSMASQQRHQQQQRAISMAMSAQPSYQGPSNQQPIQQHHHLGLSTGISLLHPPAPPQSQQQAPSTHMLLFNDGEDDVYQAENTTSMYFDNDDSSYSELSDTSPDGLESRPFAAINQNNFNGKFHLPSPQMFNNSSVAKSSTVMPNGGAVLNPTCIHPTSCTLAIDQQPCGLLSQTSPATLSGQSLLMAPFQPSSCAGPSSNVTSTSLPLHGRSLLTNSLSLDMVDNGQLIQSSMPSFPGKFAHGGDLDTSLHLSSSAPSYKLDPSMMPAQSYGSSSGPVVDYLPPSHIAAPNPVTFNSSVNPSNFDTLQSAPCWTTSLVRTTLPDCYGTPTLTTNSSMEQHVPSKANFQQDLDPCVLSPTTTYATMTTTTRDLLAAHCPGISPHVDSKLEPVTSSSIKNSETYPSYHLSSPGSGPSADLMYTYPDRSNTTDNICSSETLDRASCSLSGTIFHSAPARPLSCSEITSTLLPSASTAPSDSFITPLDSTALQCSTASKSDKNQSVFYTCCSTSSIPNVCGSSNTYTVEETAGMMEEVCPHVSGCSQEKSNSKWNCQDSNPVEMLVEIPGEGPESETIVSSATSSSSSSPNTSEEEKDSNVAQSFGEIMKESIVEMVLV